MLDICLDSAIKVVSNWEELKSVKQWREQMRGDELIQSNFTQPFYPVSQFKVPPSPKIGTIKKSSSPSIFKLQQNPYI